MFAYIYIYIYIYIYALCIHVRIYVYVYVCMYVCTVMARVSAWALINLAAPLPPALIQNRRLYETRRLLFS